MLQRADALTDDFVPGDVTERHTEIDQLAGVLEPTLKGEYTEHALIFGPSGAGKTCIARYCLQQIEQQHLGVHTQHIDCWQHHTRRKAIEQLCLGCGQGAVLHQQLAHDDLLDRIRELDQPYIVILDEIDQLDDLTLLRELYGMEGVAIVGIANRERELFSRLDDWLNTRLRSSTTITLSAYTDAELVAILKRRADEALLSGSIATEQLETITRSADGNAGLAIGTLRQAARRASQASVDMITNEIIAEALPAAKREQRQKSISRLTHAQRQLYEQLPEDGSWIRSEKLYAAYNDAVEDPRENRTRRYWFSKMQQYNLVEKRGKGRGVEYRRVVQATEPIEQ
jgi:Cdc6-like AAA superfamily ATPase